MKHLFGRPKPADSQYQSQDPSSLRAAHTESCRSATHCLNASLPGAMPTSAQARVACDQVSRSALCMASALWVPHAANSAAKEEIKIMRDIAISNLRGVSGFLVLRSLRRATAP